MKIKKNSIKKWGGLTLVLILCLVTFYSLTNTQRFYVDTDQLLVDPLFLESERHWKTKGNQLVRFTQSGLSITNASQAFQEVSQNIRVKTPAYIRISFDGVTQRVAGGAKPWSGASASLAYRNAEGERLRIRMFTQLHGSNNKRSYVYTERLRESVDSVDVSFRLLQSQGMFIVSNPKLSLLKEFFHYRILKLVITVLWVIAFSLLIYSLLGSSVRSHMYWVFGTGTLVLAGVLMPDFLLSAVSQSLASVMPDQISLGVSRVLSGVFGSEWLSDSGAEMSKLGHFAIFFCIGLSASWQFPKTGLIFTAAGIFVFAFCTEALQLLVDGRSTNMSDVAIDCAGALLGIVLGVGLVFLAKLYKPGKARKFSSKVLATHTRKEAL